ncbi:MAG: hypothetical protein SGARI_001951, partial [Bacillariaceae sp.]
MFWLQDSEKPKIEAAAKAEGNSSSDDRYAVAPAGSTTESALDSNLSSGSSYISGGTSFESDDSALDLDGFDAEDFDELMYHETHGVVGGWVDSACGWLDKPMCLLPFTNQTSLLKESKGRTKTALQKLRMNDTMSTVANMKLSAKERRNLRLYRKGLPALEEGDDALSTNSSQYISTQRIQPRTIDGEGTEKSISKSKKKSHKAKDKKKQKDTKTKGGETSESSAHESDKQSMVSKEENPSAQTSRKKEKKKKKKQADDASVKSRDPEGSHHSRLVSPKEDNVESSTRSEGDGELSQTLDKVLMDTPEKVPAVGENVAEALAMPQLELPESESIRSGSVNTESGTKGVPESKNESSRSERTGVRSIRKNKIMEVVQS